MLWGCQAPEHPGGDDAAGMLDPTRISCEEDARPQENILGRKMLQGSGFFWSIQRKPASLHVALPWAARVTWPGSAWGLHAWLPAAAGREWSSPSSQIGIGAGGESPASIIPASSRQIPRGNGYFWASPRAIKSPVGAGTAVPQQEVMLPSPSRHKHPE